MKETGFDKWKKKLLFSDALLLFIGLIFLAMLRADKVLVFAYLFALAYLIITKRKKLLYHLILATAISILWLSFSKDLYSYNVEFIRFGSISIFPLLAWALGLFVSYLIYSHFEHKLKNHSFGVRFMIFAGSYWIVLLLVESIFYNSIGIQDIATAAYPGLPICNCLHAPRWMQAAYFLMGPIYFLLCNLLKLENPHIKKHH